MPGGPSVHVSHNKLSKCTETKMVHYTFTLPACTPPHAYCIVSHTPAGKRTSSPLLQLNRTHPVCSAPVKRCFPFAGF